MYSESYLLIKHHVTVVDTVQGGNTGIYYYSIPVHL